MNYPELEQISDGNSWLLMTVTLEDHQRY